MGLVRHPAVAGRFYPGDAQVLAREVRAYLLPAEKVRAIGCVAPHAGYMYSGHVAGAVLSAVEIPSRILVLCPNHTGMGKPLAIMSEGTWQTPLGEVAIDRDLASALREHFPLLTEDASAHRAEHAIEVLLPFLQLLSRNLSFVPVAMGVRRFHLLQDLGEAIARVLEAEQSPVLIVASSDMNHYENDAVTRRKDQLAIEEILALDPRRLLEVVEENHISMCGLGPAVAMLVAARRLGAVRADLIRYATSADVSGDFHRVVGYAGILVR
jgi:AmmeMemoRadiSam system protein B